MNRFRLSVLTFVLTLLVVLGGIAYAGILTRLTLNPASVTGGDLSTAFTRWGAFMPITSTGLDF